MTWNITGRSETVLSSQQRARWNIQLLPLPGIEVSLFTVQYVTDSELL